MPSDYMSPSSPTEKVVLKFSAQSGKTEILLNVLGFYAAEMPGPILVVQPNQKPMSEEFSKNRVTPMFRDTPALASLLTDEGGRKHSTNTILSKQFPGGTLSMIGANSPSSLASRPIRVLLCDEIDRYVATKEGDALALATKRTRTFSNRKILVASTPTFEEMGVYREYEQCERQYVWQLRCLGCDEYSYPQLENFLWDDRDASSARLVCHECGYIHEHHEEFRSKATGKWVKVLDDGDRTVGFQFNQFCSPFALWSETISEFLLAQGSPERLQAVTNTAFCKPWVIQGEVVDTAKVMARAEDYQLVPDKVLVLTAGVDTQDDRLEIEVVGWVDGEESWQVQYHVIHGDTSDPKTWSQLDKYLGQEFTLEGGRKLGISCTCIDSGGHRTTEVYTFCAQRVNRRIFAIKGVAGEGKPIISASQNKMWGNQHKKTKLFLVGVDGAKRIVHARMQQEEHGEGYCHLPKSLDQEWYDQFAAEELRTKNVGGRDVWHWVQTRVRNEALDCRVYAFAAMRLLHPVWQQLASNREEKPMVPELPALAPARRRFKPSRAGFASAWR
jgi:phage terminase large subunit GpA-like protein